jgi:hypothetical protein
MYFKHRKKLPLQLTSLINRPYQATLHLNNTNVPMNSLPYYLIFSTQKTCEKLMQRVQNRNDTIVNKVIMPSNK